MITLVIILFCLIVAIGFGAASALSDFNSLTIPNIYVIGVLLAFLPAYGVLFFVDPEISIFSSLKSHLVSFGLGLGITFILFATKMIGAGDSKLFAAYALWVSIDGIMPFLFFMSLTGGVLAAASWAIKKYKPFKNPKEKSWISEIQAGRSAVPYGIAIFVGVLFAFGYQGYFTLAPYAEILQGSHF